MSPIIFVVLIIAYLHAAVGRKDLVEGGFYFADDLADRSSEEESLCTTPTGASGTCKSLYECDALLTFVYNKERTPLELFTLQKSQCGFIGNTPKVCCPEPCTTPDGKTGECISIYSCDKLSSLLRPPFKKESMEFVQNSRCENEGQYGVCCPLPEVGNCEQRVNAFPPDPRSHCCGLDSIVGNKIVGGTATTVDQYPWLGIIDYLKDGTLRMMCGAALISGNHMLTAGHCVAGAILDYGIPTYIRLGEYDTGNEGPDCIPVEAGGTDCTTGSIRIRITQTIPHPDYNPISPLRRHDIALIKMAELVPFTDFIRPICLPSVDYTSQPPKDFSMFVAGWGAVNTTLPKSKIKLHVKVPYVPPEVCQPVYSSRKTPLWEKQLCAGGEAGKDSCKGDSGGPLMFENGRTFEALGIVSFGPLPCGIEDVPGVYTKVYEYRDWIRKTITP